MPLNIIETKLFKELKETTKKYNPLYRCNLTFKSKAFEFINLLKIFRLKEMYNNLPSNFEISEIPMIMYNHNPYIISTF